MSPKTAALIREYFSKALKFDENNYSLTSLNSSFYIQLCDTKQPRRIRFRYWFGVAQIIAGCIAAPFSAGTSLALITSGVATVGSAAGDALDNKDRWEDDLNRRQRMGLENTASISSNRMHFSFNFVSV